MDSGSACSRYNIYGQMVYWEITSWTISLEYGHLLFYGDEAIHYQWTISLDVIITMLLSINGTFTCCIQVMSTTQFSSSDVAIIDVCIYYGQRFAPINIPNYAGSVGNTIFFLWHTCHVMSCHVMSWYYVMLYNIACYRIWWYVSVLHAIVCMYLGSNSHSVLL